MRLFAVLGALLGVIALFSWKAAVVTALGVCAGYVLVRYVVMGVLNLAIWLLGKVIAIGEDAFDAATSGEQGVLAGLYGELAQHELLLRALYPDVMANAAAERHREYVLLDETFDLAARRRENRALQDELIRSPDFFLAELRAGCAEYGWFDAAGLARAEQEIRDARRELRARLRREVDPRVQPRRRR